MEVAVFLGAVAFFEFWHGVNPAVGGSVHMVVRPPYKLRPGPHPTVSRGLNRSIMCSLFNSLPTKTLGEVCPRHGGNQERPVTTLWSSKGLSGRR